MFTDLVVAAPVRPKRAYKAQIVEQIQTLLSGNTMKLREIYRAFADEPYFASEIASALTMLKKSGIASWEGKLDHNTLVKIARV